MLGAVATAVPPLVLLQYVKSFDPPLRKSFIATNMPFLTRLATLAGFGVTLFSVSGEWDGCELHWWFTCGAMAHLLVRPCPSEMELVCW